MTVPPKGQSHRCSRRAHSVPARRPGRSVGRPKRCADSNHDPLVPRPRTPPSPWQPGSVPLGTCRQPNANWIVAARGTQMKPEAADSTARGRQELTNGTSTRAASGLEAIPFRQEGLSGSVGRWMTNPCDALRTGCMRLTDSGYSTWELRGVDHARLTAPAQTHTHPVPQPVTTVVQIPVVRGNAQGV
jgi:hypothetical protein